MKRSLRSLLPWLTLAGVICLVAAIYWPGLSGGFLFDDYPNIVDNHDLQISRFDVPSLAGAALSSPSSEFRRPLASLSFALNYLATGMDPYGMKLTNLVIHLLNGLLLFILTRQLIALASPTEDPKRNRNEFVALLVVAAWLVMPINVTAVLYVVQRMESMANLFVVLGLIGYVASRKAMQQASSKELQSAEWKWFLLAATSITLPTAMGLLAKETAVMLPLYALTIEWILFGFRRKQCPASQDANRSLDKRVITLYALVLCLPMALGLIWLVPQVLRPESWITRNFTLHTRLLSEARIVVDYIGWTLLPTPQALSFYHDDFVVSQGLLSPFTTLISILTLIGLIWIAVWLRIRKPLISLGVFLFLGCQLLTATILPLELVYEHRNYFASFGLALAVIPLLATPVLSTPRSRNAFILPRITLLGGLILLWGCETTITATDWSSPLRLAQALADRAPNSPRAQYELGRTYIIYSHYDPHSLFTTLAYPALEKAASLPDSSILPEQALIFMNARMRLPLKEQWWDSMVNKLKARKATVQDESSLSSLVQCVREGDCDLPKRDMMRAFQAALSHPNPSARLLAMYSDYAWNVLEDHDLGLRAIEGAVSASPNEPAYYITLIRMLMAENHASEANDALRQLERLNIGGRLNNTLAELRKLPGLQTAPSG
jgi:protein O-mannosyl-transferase